MRVTKVKLQLQHSDGHHSTTEVITTSELAERFMSKLIDWQNNYGGSVNEVKEFLQRVEEVDWDKVGEIREEWNRKSENIFE